MSVGSVEHGVHTSHCLRMNNKIQVQEISVNTELRKSKQRKPILNMRNFPEKIKPHR